MPQTLPRPLQVLVTAGGLLWRRRAGVIDPRLVGRRPPGALSSSLASGSLIEICLLSTPDRSRWMVPRSRVHEDERAEEAAVRAVHDLTGYLGTPGKQLARAASEDGEVAYLFLLESDREGRFVNTARKITASWTTLDRALDLLESPIERAVVRRAAQALSEPIDARLPFENVGAVAAASR